MTDAAFKQRLADMKRRDDSDRVHAVHFYSLSPHIQAQMMRQAHRHVPGFNYHDPRHAAQLLRAHFGHHSAVPAHLYHYGRPNLALKPAPQPKKTRR